MHAIAKLTSDLCWHLNNKKLVGACLIELQKAFDSVWIEGLIFKLINYTFEKNLILIIYSMINNRNFKIIKNGQQSSLSFIIENGLQQGAVSSPKLFNIYTVNLNKN